VSDVPLEQIDGDLEQELIEGRLDALLTTKTKDEQAAPEQRQLRALIPDVARVEQEYFARTGIYPINHVVVIRCDVLTRLPELPQTLVEAYGAAKQAAYERRLGATLIPWGSVHWRQMFDLFGGDPMPYGLGKQNRTTLQTFVGYLREQSLIGRQADLMMLFAGEP
jgi:4,5-dihydroxyphthalate decarboxylase